MSIVVTEIEQGWIYKIKRNQDRLVLGFDGEGKVVYASRGGNAMNPFDSGYTKSDPDRFASACIEKTRKVPDIQHFIKLNNATAAIV